MTGTSIFTIGHSTHTLQEFLDMLGKQQIELVIDVRKLPGSNRYPQFNRDNLRSALAESGIDYRWTEGLTGRRPVSRTVPFEVNAWWQSRSFHNYADHALGKEFANAMEQVHDLADGQRLALMCSEAVWWRCHRRIIADHLMARGNHVSHIMGQDQVVDAKLSDGARRASDGEVTYPAQSE